MQKMRFSPRHTKLIQLKNDIDVLKLGQSNKEYINMIQDLRNKVVEELKIEQSKLGIIPNNELPRGEESLS